MQDILTVYAETQPEKLAVVDDKGGDDVVQVDVRRAGGGG